FYLRRRLGLAGACSFLKLFLQSFHICNFISPVLKMSSSSSSMSKEKLKSELQSRNIPLPPTGSKKEVYVQLYQKYLTNAQTREPRASEFSSDEEDAHKYTKGHTKEKSIFTTVTDSLDSVTLVLDGVRVNINELSDDELRQYLLKNNVAAGPIVETTRSVYERKLARILLGEMEGEMQNGQYQQAEDEYSDSESDEILTPVITPNINSGNRKKKQDDSPIIYNVVESENTSSKRNYSRETPTPRRSLRDNISYTPVDRTLYADLMRHRNEETVSKLASNVVENTPEPVNDKKRSKNSSMMKKLLFIVLLMVIASVIVYCNMEGSNTDEISHLPSLN
uniref:LEM domain-containing protein n=1 Tax=Strigamia maritima TaxID=126957 RepID=T1J0E8_STRMM